MLNLSETSADAINSWSTIASIIAAVVTAITAYTAFWSAVILKRHADQRIAKAALSAQEAQQDVAKAQVRIAEANLAAAQARAEAAEAGLETAKTSTRLAATQGKLNQANTITPLSDDRLAQLRRSLRGYVVPPNAVVFPAAPNNRQAEYIATQINTVLTEVGIPRPLGEGIESYFATGVEAQEIIIAYGKAVPKDSAKDLAARFENAGFSAAITVGRVDANPTYDEISSKFIEIRITAKSTPSF